MVSVLVPRKTVTAITANATAAAGTHTPVDATGGAVTVTLPTGKGEGAHLSIEKVDSSTNAVTISGSIRGTAITIPLNYQYETIELIAQASGTWRVISNHLPKSAVDKKIADQATSDAAAYLALPGGSVASGAVPTKQADGTVVYAVPAAAGVSSVAGRSGAVALYRADVGLGNVDNTADASKPVSSAQNSAINAKASATVNGNAVNLLNFTDAGVADVPGVGQASGIADLDSNGQVPLARLGNAPSVAALNYNPQPHINGMLGWTSDVTAVAAQVGLTAGVLGLYKMEWPATATITNLITTIVTAGASLVGCYAAVFDSSGNRLGVTADQSTNWTTVGAKTMALAGGGVSVPGGSNKFIYLALLVGSGSGTVANMFYKAGTANAAALNAGLAAAASRAATIGSGQTAVPSTVTMGSLVQSSTLVPIGVS